MKIFLKYFTVFICFLAVFGLSSVIAGAILVVFQKFIPLFIQSIISYIIAFIPAFFVAKLVWKNSTIKKVSFFSSALIGGFVLGSIGFLGGFIGPIIFMPSSNQGPLLGIFITGPLGFIIGLIIGAVYYKVKIRKH
jgi:hypothetical protein